LKHEYIREYKVGDLVQYRVGKRMAFGAVVNGAIHTVGVTDNSMLQVDRYKHIANGIEASMGITKFKDVDRNFGQIPFVDFFKQNPEYFV